MALLPPELWSIIFKHLRRLWFLDKVKRLDEAKIFVKPLVIASGDGTFTRPRAYHIYKNWWHSIRIFEYDYIQEPSDIIWRLLHEVDYGDGHIKIHHVFALDMRGINFAELY
jgi:hypothetical protein